MEIWKKIPTLPEFYEASNLGNIRVLDRVIRKKQPSNGKVIEFFYSGKLLSKCEVGGYEFVSVGYNGKTYSHNVAKLVLMAFGGLNKGKFCCHNDGNPKNNNIENLRWGTHLDNMADRKKHGRYYFGEKHPMAKANKDVIRKVKSGELTPSQAAKLTGLSYKIFWRAKVGESWCSNE